MPVRKQNEGGYRNDHYQNMERNHAGDSSGRPPGHYDLPRAVSGAESVSSAGLRVLLSAHKTMSAKGGMKVAHVNEIVQEVFDVTGFSDILTIE